MIPMQDCDGLARTLGLMGWLIVASVAVPVLKLSKTSHERCRDVQALLETEQGFHLLNCSLLSLGH